jgi:hypothetical protein
MVYLNESYTSNKLTLQVLKILIQGVDKKPNNVNSGNSMGRIILRAAAKRPFMAM